MKIYDISQEVFSCSVYDGDPTPEKTTISSMEKGDLYNLTSFSMCAHNGTHLDAPAHFIMGGDTVDMLPLEKTVGKAYVCSASGVLDEISAGRIIDEAVKCDPEAAKRILINGDVVVSESAAEGFARAGIYLLGVTSQSVGPTSAPMAVHKLLLGCGCILLEGLRLDGVLDGMYFLCAQPLNLAGCDGAPVRAVLIDLEK